VKNNYEIIVVGGGVVGVSTAINLQKAGRNVLLLDKRGIAKETSHGNSGVIDAAYALPFAPPKIRDIPSILLGRIPAARIRFPDGLKTLPWVLDYYRNSLKVKRYQSGVSIRPLLENAVEEHKALLKDTAGLKYLKKTSRAKLYRCEESFKAANVELELLRSFAVDCNIMNASEFSEIEPDIKPAYHAVITSDSGGRYTNPQKAIEAMAQGFVEQGGSIEFEEVQSLEKKECWLVNNKYKAKEVVVCTGPWTNELLKPLGYRFPMAMKRGYHQHFKSSASINHALIDADTGFLICPMEQGIRITTGVEFADRDSPPNPIQISQVLPRARELVELHEAIDEPWLGSRPCMADSLPVVGESRKHKGLWFNFGHGHIGLAIGPSTGRLVTQMILTQKPFCDPEPYSPYRF
jgi:D-amino-acid dehydrogenase